ncbi:hypothetical protein P3X46_018863 [Hevea brasiliensis]|uniref:Uncharacterized protein n=1 Tax=Hevea brasiliensis TaxID=3981 RepID=A0ABQ9LW67_HEVBR|nr:hypothetical protein P3X46_018863 [Hevea brasiliensis]
MAFVISQSQQSLTTEDKENLSQLGPISTQIQLKSSSSQASSCKALDKEVILKRLRHHKSLNKVRNVFQALVSSSEHGNMISESQQRWLDPDDAFSSP